MVTGVLVLMRHLWLLLTTIGAEIHENVMVLIGIIYSSQIFKLYKQLFMCIQRHVHTMYILFHHAMTVHHSECNIMDTHGNPLRITRLTYAKIHSQNRCILPLL